MTHTPSPPSLSAADQAQAFVARIFAEVGTPAAPEVRAAVEQPNMAPVAAVPQPVPARAPLDYMAGRKVLIVGLGTSGLAMARWCVRCGAQVSVCDTRSNPPQLTTLRTELPQVPWLIATPEAMLLPERALDALYLSPGLSPAQLAPLLQAAQARNIDIQGELGLYSEALHALATRYGYSSRILAVTGTNGKTTVTALTAHVLAAAGKNVAVAGNIGPTLLDTLGERLDAGTLPEVWVLELSSFQLAQGHHFEPTVATVLNITQDHLDWHGSPSAYAAAKAGIFGQRAVMVLNRDDAQVMHLPAREHQRHTITFGSDPPQRPGDWGLEVVAGMTWLVRAQAFEAIAPAIPAPRKGRKHSKVASEIYLQRLLPTDALRIRGGHNALNAQAALALAQAVDAALAPMLYALRAYPGEPHRVQSIGSVAGVEYIDDSKGTNVGATVAAMTGLGTQRPLVVILGGEGKGQDFTPLAAPVARHARAVVLIGRDAGRIRQALQNTGIPLHDCATLPEAVVTAAYCAQAGDTVLLSPACASLDMFDHYAHRAQVFCAAVAALTEAADSPLPEGGAV